MEIQNGFVKAEPITASPFKRWLLPGLLGAAMIACYALGLQRYLSLQSLAVHQVMLQSFVADHLAVALGLYFLIYILVVALSFPGAGLLSLFGGFIFGWAMSAPLTIMAATLGAIAVFKIVQTSLGAVIANRAGPFVKKLSGGFEADAFNYLLFLRLVPVFPFFAVNAVAGLTRMKLRTFTLGTLIGIIPGSFAFAILGRGLGSAIEAATATHAACVAQNALAECPFGVSASSLITPQLLWAFAVLGLAALIPVALKKWKRQA